MSRRGAYGPTGMAYASVNGLQLYYEIHGRGRPLVLLHGGLLTIDLNFGPLLEPLAATRQVIALELQGHGRTADTSRPMTIEALAGDVVALLDHLGIAEADLFGFSLGGLVAYAVAIGAPTRVGKQGSRRTASSRCTTRSSAGPPPHSQRAVQCGHHHRRRLQRALRLADPRQSRPHRPQTPVTTC